MALFHSQTRRHMINAIILFISYEFQKFEKNIVEIIYLVKVHFYRDNVTSVPQSITKLHVTLVWPIWHTYSLLFLVYRLAVISYAIYTVKPV